MRTAIAGGIIMAGLMGGAITGSVWVLVGFSAAGFGLLGLMKLQQAAAAYKQAASKLAKYPSYKY